MLPTDVDVCACARVSVGRTVGLVLELEVCRVRFARVSCPGRTVGDQTVTTQLHSRFLHDCT